ncbi:MAG: hypothetical protein OZ948_03375 [Deltaproteobacteria bacterium]|nr:hypothetical protein [Deltaproteobacteria bacterium]
MDRRAIAVASLAGLGLAVLACARAPDPASTTCARVLARRLPEARVVGIDADRRASRAVVRFEVGEAWGQEPARGELSCAVEPVGSEGGWRVREATLDGVALTDAELAVVNADLFLHELARAGAR